MPAKATDDKPTKTESAKTPKADPQGHAADGPDYIPTADEYDPARHANHSHPAP